MSADPSVPAAPGGVTIRRRGLIAPTQALAPDDKVRAANGRRLTVIY